MKRKGCLMAAWLPFVLLHLFGCGKLHALDGPGMVNPFVWQSFSIYRSDSYAQHNFQITVTYRDASDSYVVTGTLMDAYGTVYEENDGIVLPLPAREAIDALRPQDLMDFVAQNTGKSGEGGDEELFFLDVPETWIEIVYTDGTRNSKVDEDGFSVKIYEIVLPYFEANAT